MLHLSNLSRKSFSVWKHCLNTAKNARQINPKLFSTHFHLYNPENQFTLLRRPRLEFRVISFNNYSTASKSDDGEQSGDEDPEVIVENKSNSNGGFMQTHLPATVAIPEVYPHLPLISTKRNPVFPRFMKIFEVR